MIDLIYLVSLSIFVSVLIGYLLKRTAPSGDKDSLNSKKLSQSQRIFGDLGDQTKHFFQLHEIFKKPTYSSSSGQPLLFGGLCCEKCGICIAPDEKSDANLYLKCKPLFIEETTVTVEAEENGDSVDGEEDHLFGVNREHALVLGNVQLNSRCSVCSNLAGTEPKLGDYYCSLCHRVIHEKCLGGFIAFNRICDMGPLSRFSIPPWCVRVKRGRTSAARLLKGKISSRFALSRICTPPNTSVDQWTPIFVFANRLSGNADAEEVIESARFHFNPCLQVFDLSVHRDPGQVLRAINDFLPTGVSFIVLVAGGDGTFRWLSDQLCMMASEFAARQRKLPTISILPLGTGNDLARSLNLGGGHVGPFEVIDYLNEITQKFKAVKLDRWEVKIGDLNDGKDVEPLSNDSSMASRSTKKSRLAALKSLRLHLPAMISSSVQSHFMYNYLSIGVDAAVTCKFAEARPLIGNNRLINKLVYGIYGLVDMFQRECHDLHENIKLSLDGRTIDNLPKIESILLLNISSWGGGCKPLELGESRGTNFATQQSDDGMLEVLGIESSLHIAQLMAGLSSPWRIGQARCVKIELLKRFPLQIDGEPFKQSPACITVKCCGQVDVFANEG